MAETVEAQLTEFDRDLSRFRHDSELSRLNRDPREVVPASPLLRAAVSAGLWAAERTGGLVDPTLLPHLEAAGYVESRSGVASEPLDSALASAPSRRPAGPAPDPAWRLIRVLEEEGAIRRPPSVKLDSGGIGEGLAADLVGRQLAGYARYVMDCGGDVLVGGKLPESAPIELQIRHPLTWRCRRVIRVRAWCNRDIRPGRASVEASRRHARAPFDRSGQLPARLDRPDLRGRACADRARGRRARQGCAAQRPRRRSRGPRRARRSSRPGRRQRPAHRPAARSSTRTDRPSLTVLPCLQHVGMRATTECMPRVATDVTGRNRP